MTPSGMPALSYLNEYLVKIEGDRFKDCSYGVSTDVKTYHHYYLCLDQNILKFLGLLITDPFKVPVFSTSETGIVDAV